jgi:hypothetical protein
LDAATVKTWCERSPPRARVMRTQGVRSYRARGGRLHTRPHRSAPLSCLTRQLCAVCPGEERRERDGGVRCRRRGARVVCWYNPGVSSGRTSQCGLARTEFRTSAPIPHCMHVPPFVSRRLERLTVQVRRRRSGRLTVQVRALRPSIRIRSIRIPRATRHSEPARTPARRCTH